jgi:hypothetical protein
MAIHLGLAQAKQIEVRAVENGDLLCHCASFGRRDRAGRLPAMPMLLIA